MLGFRPAQALRVRSRVWGFGGFRVWGLITFCGAWGASGSFKVSRVCKSPDGWLGVKGFFPLINFSICACHPCAGRA